MFIGEVGFEKVLADFGSRERAEEIRGLWHVVAAAIVIQRNDIVGYFAERLAKIGGIHEEDFPSALGKIDPMAQFVLIQQRIKTGSSLLNMAVMANNAGAAEILLNLGANLQRGAPDPRGTGQNISAIALAKAANRPALTALFTQKDRAPE